MGKERTRSSYRPRAEVPSEDKFEAAYITAETRDALNSNRQLRKRVRDELHECLQDYGYLDVRVDRVSHLVDQTTMMVQKLQRATGLSLSWYQRPVRLCLEQRSADVYYPDVVAADLGRLYFRLSVDGQGTLCECMRGRPSMEGHRCFCAWLSDHLSRSEGIAPSTQLGLACAQNWEDWNLAQTAALYAWTNIRTLSLLAHLVGDKMAIATFEGGAYILSQKTKAAMETGEDHRLVGQSNPRR